jgi:hypothetical protein
MRRHTRLRRAGHGLGSLALAAACACGSGGEPAPEQPLEAPEASAAAAPAANQPPVLQALRFDPDPPLPGQRVTLHAQVSDPDGDDVRLVYSWRLDGADTGRGEAAFDVPQQAKGRLLEATVVAHDGHQEGPARTLSAEVGNQVPKLVDLMLEPAQGLTVQSEIVASPRAVDGDGDPVVFQYTWRVNGRRVKQDGAALTSRYFERGDSVVLEVRASDGDDWSEPIRSPALTIENSLPVVTSSPKGLDESGSFHYTPVIEDADGDRRLRFRLVQGPPGMQIDWLRGTVSWQPSEEQEGKHPVEIEVDDGSGGTATQNFVLDVKFEAPPAKAAPPAAAAAP